MICSDLLQPPADRSVNLPAMKESTSSFWPRGLLVGALLAAFLIIPVFVVMMFDAAAGTARLSADDAARFAMFQRPLQLRASSDFFEGRLAVQAVLSQRFARLPAGDGVKATGERRDLLAANAPSEPARSNMLRLRLENRSTENIEVEIVRVDSGLGNFVARPDRLMLAPDQSANVDSLVAGQKITANSIPVAIALRLAGNVETRKLVLNDRTLAKADN
jgi:hypothetical protein